MVTKPLLLNAHIKGLHVGKTFVIQSGYIINSIIQKQIALTSFVT